MNWINLSLVLLLSFTSLASETFLTEEQSYEVITEIDNICGDTWCEGDFNFEFESIECSLISGCKLSMTLWDGYEERDDVKKTYSGSCVVAGFSNYNQMIEISENGWQQLSYDFYEAVSDCVSDVEEEAYKVL